MAIVALALFALLFFSACSTDAEGFEGRPSNQLAIPSGGGVPDGTGESPSLGDLEPNPADGLHVFVSPDGDDNNDGQTPETPWRSLLAAIRAVQPGNVVWVMDGVYDEKFGGQAHYYIDKSGTPDAWIRFRAMPGHRPIVEGSSTSGFEVAGSYIEIQGFEIRGVGFNTENSYGYGVVAAATDHVRVIENEIHGFPTGGFGSSASSHLSVIGNTVYENALWDSDQGSGISMWRLMDRGFDDDEAGYSNYIVGNTVYSNENRVFCGFCAEEFGQENILTDGNAIIVDQNKLDIDGNKALYPGRTLIANNVAFNNGGRAVNVFLSQRVDVLNNTTYRNLQTEDLHGAGSEISAFDSEDVLIGNNLVVPLSGKDAIILNGKDLKRQSNIIANGKDGPTGNDLMVPDAGLVNPSTDPAIADFRLRISSPAIDAAIGWLTMDIDGLPRGQRPDVGAYEATVGGADNGGTTTQTTVPAKQQPDE